MLAGAPGRLAPGDDGRPEHAHHGSRGLIVRESVILRQRLPRRISGKHLDESHRGSRRAPAAAGSDGVADELQVLLAEPGVKGAELRDEMCLVLRPAEPGRQEPVAREQGRDQRGEPVPGSLAPASVLGPTTGARDVVSVMQAPKRSVVKPEGQFLLNALSNFANSPPARRWLVPRAESVFPREAIILARLSRLQLLVGPG